MLSLSLIFVDFRFDQLDKLRQWLGAVVTPVQWLSDIPHDISSWAEDLFSSRQALQEELDAMRAKTLILERKAQKLASITAEVNRLRELLNASRLIDDEVLVAEMIGVSPDPYNQYVVINRGTSDDVYVGQAVLDAEGLMGQVIEVNEFTSRVLLITDNTHAIPVQVNRNGVRAIAYGIGNLDSLELANVPDTADITVGDLLVSSGLGGRFPAGYPVATVVTVVHDPGQQFARVKIKPRARLNQSRLVLLVFQSDKIERTAIPAERP